jgi:outer membrane protein TolC
MMIKLLLCVISGALTLSPAPASASTAPLPAASPDAAPSAAPTVSPDLPPIERGLALPYPAYGSPQPQVIMTRRQASVPAVVTLDAATAIAIDRVPSLAAARAQVALEDAAVQLERTGLAPDLSIAAAAKHSYIQGISDAQATASQAATGSSVGVGQSNTAQISLAQLIFDGGQIRAKIDAARLTRDATLATYRRSAQTVAYDVATSYYAVLQDERTVAVDDQLLAQDVVSENLVRAQIRAGTQAGADLSTQLAITANARTALVSAQGLLQNDRVAFATALGLDADIDVLPQDDAQGFRTATPPLALPAFAGALGVAYAERPDLDQARLTVRSSEASLRAAKRGLSPTLSLAADKALGSTNPGGGAYLNDGSVALDLTIPVYDQGITRANVASSRAQVAIATSEAATTQLTIQQDVRQALIAIVSDRSTLDSTRVAYASGIEALRSTQGQYRAGVSTLPALIQAQSTLASAATNIVNAIYTLRLAQSNLRFALGTILQ